MVIKLNEAVEFPADFVDQLNSKKEELVVMQIVRRGTLPEPIPKTERSKLPDLVDWEALQFTERSLTFRILFKDPTLISANDS